MGAHHSHDSPSKGHHGRYIGRNRPKEEEQAGYECHGLVMGPIMAMMRTTILSAWKFSPLNIIATCVKDLLGHHGSYHSRDGDPDGLINQNSTSIGVRMMLLAFTSMVTGVTMFVMALAWRNSMHRPHHTI